MRDLPEPFTTPMQLKLARTAQGMSQDDLALAVGVARATINRVETGQVLMLPSLARHAALLFHYLAATPSQAGAKGPSARPPRANVTYLFTQFEPPHPRVEGIVVEGMAPGSRYRRQEWRGTSPGQISIMVRGSGTRFEDQIEGQEPELSDQAWLDNTAKRFE